MQYLSLSSMRNRSLIVLLLLTMIIAIVMRKLGLDFASLLLNVTVFSLSVVILFSKEIFRTLLARVTVVASLFAALAILQYWLESEYIIIPVAIAFLFFMFLSFKYVQQKISGMVLFLIIIVILSLSVFLNPRQFHNFFRKSSYEDFVLSRFRQDQGLLADLSINRYKKIDLFKSNEYLKRAFIEDSLKNLDAALDLYCKSIERNPDNPVAYHRRGFFKLTKLELNPPNVVSALKDFSRSIRLDKKFAAAYYHRSMAYNYLGYKDRAFLDRLKVLQLDSLMQDTLFEAKYGSSKKALSVPPNP